MNEEDVGDSPIRKSETIWKAGESANPAGKSKGTKNAKPRSKMRSTLAGLYKLQDKAMAIIAKGLEPVKVVEGKRLEEIDKGQMDTAKFVVKAIESFNNTCLREELAILGIRAKDEPGAEEIQENQDEPVKEVLFSMDMDTVASNLKH